MASEQIVAEPDNLADDEFEYETKMMVLNFMSLLPMDIASQHTSHSGSLASSSSSSERQRKLFQQEQSSFDSSSGSNFREGTAEDGGPSWQQTLPSLPEASLVDRILMNKKDEVSDKQDPADMKPPSPIPAIENFDSVVREIGHRRAKSGEALPPDEREMKKKMRSPGSKAYESVLRDIKSKQKLSRFNSADSDRSPSKRASLKMEEVVDGSPVRSIVGDDDYFEDQPDMIRSERPKRLDISRVPLVPQQAIDEEPTPRESSPPRLPSSRYSILRQTSNLSNSSDSDASDVSSLVQSRCSGMSTRSNFIDVQNTDVDLMVRRGVLPPSVLPLHDQLNQEMDILLQKQRSIKGKSPSPNPRGSVPSAPQVTPSPVERSVHPPYMPSVSVMTPQTEVAEQLRIIGDNVNVQYGKDVERAFNTAMSLPKDQLTYSFMEKILLELIDHVPGVSNRVALVLLLCQKIVLYRQDLHRLVEFAVRFLMDRMASYIITRGGWTSILGLDDFIGSGSAPNDVQSTVADNTDGASLVPPPNPIHMVSTSSTLVPSDNEMQENIDSLVDSGFLPGPSTSSQMTSQSNGLDRDETLDSIASIAADISPVRNIDSTTTTPQTGAAGDFPSVKFDEETTKKDDDNSCVANVREEINYLRQTSDIYCEENRPENRQTGPSMPTMGLLALGGAMCLCSGYILYKKYK